MGKASKRNIKVASKAKAPVVTAPAPQATPSEAISERRATSRKVANTAYQDRAAYPFGKLSPADRLYVALFAHHAKRGGGQFSTSVLDLAEAKPPGVSITNNRARAHRLMQAGFLNRKSDDVFEFVAAITKPKADEKRPDVLYAVSTYAKA